MSGLNKNSKFRFYINKNIELIRSITIKSDSVAEAMNVLVALQSDEVIDEKSGWKYYQNISGNYHFTDNLINVVSLDTGDTIVFNKENLRVHKLTKKEYSNYQSRYYLELITLYPLQELLIKGILSPVNIDAAISSKDGTILGHDTSLIEENEYNLIDRLQKWLYAYIDRWINKNYYVSDEYYLALTQSQMYLHLLQVLLCYRLDNCKTNQAHSYHIEEYLASHGYLDKYIKTLTKGQALFFYRNISYLERNPGKKDTFDWVLSNTMTVRNLPIYEYVVNHNIKDLSTEKIYPTLQIDRLPVNEVASKSALTSLSFDQALQTVNAVVPNNEEYNLDNVSSIQNDLVINESSTVLTKSLQSVVVDKSEVDIFPIKDTSINNWIKLVSEDLYKPNIIVDVPDKLQPVVCTAKEAVVLYNATKMMLYQDKADVLDLPASQVECVAVVNKDVTYNDILTNIDTKYISYNDISNIMDKVTESDTIYSIEDYKDTYANEHINKHEMYSLYSSKEHMLSRVTTQIAVNRIYENKVITIDDVSDKKYSEVFDNLGIDISNYSNDDIIKLNSNIENVVTGIDYSRNKVDVLQSSMTELLISLSSYSIQIMNEVNKEPIVMVPRISVRLGDIYSYADTTDKVSINYITVTGNNSSCLDKTYLNILKKLNIVDRTTLYNRGRVELPKLNKGVTIKNNTSIRIQSTPTKNIKNKRLSIFNELTDIQKQSLLN